MCLKQTLTGILPLWILRLIGSIALANSADSDNASALSRIAHNASVTAAKSHDRTDHLDAALAHRQAANARPGARAKDTADMHNLMCDYHLGKAGTSEAALGNSGNPFLPRRINSSVADNPHAQQFNGDRDLPPARATINRAVGASPEDIDTLAARPDDLTPEEANTVLNVIVQRAISADVSAASDSSKLATHWNAVKLANPVLSAKAFETFKPKSETSDDNTDERAASALYNSKFRELLPQCGNDPVRTHREIKLLHPHLVPARKH